MIIFGWGHRTLKKYGTIQSKTCVHCYQNRDIDLIKITIWFTLFFIPVIPISRRYLLMCLSCKGIEELDKETFFEYVDNKENKGYQPTKQSFNNKTQTQINFLKEMETLKKEKEEKKSESINKEDKISKESLLIKNSNFPVTKDYLIESFKKMGIQEGMHVMVHSSLSSLGWVCGGAVTVIQALKEVVTNKGTIIMPTHSGDLSDPKNWMYPPVPKDWQQIIRDTMPAFDTHLTPTRGMGKIPEIFRALPNVYRSYHPQVSFAAWGEKAIEITKDHSLNNCLSKTSPLGKIYDISNTFILLLGVDFGNNTIFHLAEYESPNVEKQIKGAPIIKDNQRIWEEFEDIDYDDSDFSEIGKAFEQTHNVTTQKIGLSTSKLFSAKEAVDFAVKWIKENRK